jgi:hypothetical protein
MKTLNHLMDPKNPPPGNPVHYEDPDGRQSWCPSRMRVFVLIDGDRIRVLHHTKQPVTCKSCIKKMEKEVRAMLGQLSAEQLEDIAAHVDTFQHRYMPVSPIS